MKNAKILIEHIYDNPSYKKLNSVREYAKLIKLLEPSHQKMIQFCYVKNDTLFFALKHPLALQELKRDSNIFSIKGLLKILILKSNMEGKSSVFSNVIHIKFFVTKFTNLKTQIPNSTKIFRKFYSRGEFVNSCKNQTLYQKFEELREILKARANAN